MLSGTNNFNETSALGLGVTHSLLHGPVPVRLPDLSQQTAPALPTSILGEAPQGSSLDALASMASFFAEHHRANVARGLPPCDTPAMANTPTLTDVPSTGPCRMIGDQGGPWVHQDNTGLPPQALDMSLQAATASKPCTDLASDVDRQASMLSLRATKAHATRDEIDRQGSVLSLKATQARALCAEIDRQASVLSLKATQARTLCAEIHRLDSVLEQL